MLIRIIYNNKWSSFLELLKKVGLFAIHMMNIQYLAADMISISRNL